MKLCVVRLRTGKQTSSVCVIAFVCLSFVYFFAFTHVYAIKDVLTLLLTYLYYICLK